MKAKSSKSRDTKNSFPELKFPQNKSSPRVDENPSNYSCTSKNQLENSTVSSEDKHWTELENCLKNIDKNYENPEFMSKIRNSASHIESLKELVAMYSELKGIKNEYEVITRQDEVVYLFKTGKNDSEFFKIFDELMENCWKLILSKKKNAAKELIDIENEAKIISEYKNLAKFKQEAECQKKAIGKVDEKLINTLIFQKLNVALKKVDEKFLEIDLKNNEMDKRVGELKKLIKKMKSVYEKKWNRIWRAKVACEQKPQLSLPVKRRRHSIVESVKNARYKSIESSSDEFEYNSDDSLLSIEDSTTERKINLDNMIFKLRLRGNVKMTDIWRLNNFAVIFNLNELKTKLDPSFLDDLSKQRPWASRWKAKDKYFSSMKIPSSPQINRNINKFDNSKEGIISSLTETYLFHFDLYCTWRKLKLWLKNINNTIDLCITPSYPHKIRSVIADESEKGLAALLEKALPNLNKQRLDRTPNLILYSFIEDYPNDYLVKSQFCIVGRHQLIDLRKIVGVSWATGGKLKNGQEF